MQTPGRLAGVLVVVCMAATALAQSAPPATRQQWEAEYQRRIKLESINGVYIPKDIDDALLTLNGLIDKSSKEKFRSMPEADAAHKLHFSFGRWMIVNWGLYEGSRLSHYFRINLKISHPDDIARFLIILYHRSLNRRPLEVPALIAQFHEKQELERKQRLEQGTIIHQETRPKKKEGGG